MEAETEEVADLVARFKDALAVAGMRDEDHLVPFGDGHLHSVEQVIAFISGADVDDHAWVQVTGFFHKLGDLDSKWLAIQRVADANLDADKLSMLAVYAFEAIIEQTRDELPVRLETAGKQSAVREMLGSCVVSMRYDGVIEPYIERDQSPDAG